MRLHLGAWATRNPGRPKVGIVRRDGSQKQRNLGADDTCGYPPPRRAVFAQRIRRGRSFQLPANTGCRQGRKGRVPATGEYRVPPGEEGEGPRHPASARKPQHNYPAKALRAVGRGVGRAEPLTSAFQLSPSIATETKQKRVRPAPPVVEATPEASPAYASNTRGRKPYGH
jgi:hypothetical protein